MRCERCGTEIESGALCDVCAETGEARSIETFSTYMNALGLVFLAFLLLAVGMALYGPGGCAYDHPPKRSPSLLNIKQLELATLQYSEDYQGILPGWVRNPDGQYAHNCWDEQIDPDVKSKELYAWIPDSGRGIRSFSQKGTQDRVVTYGLNGLLITPAQARFDGDADFGAVNAKHPPEPLSPSAMADPAGTILFAELATDAPMAGVYGQEPEPKPYTYIPGETSKQWQEAHTGWIDISPRAFVETGKGVGSYQDPYTEGATDCGIARDLYGGGGVYAFCDGHVQFLKISKSVGIGTMVNNNKTVTVDNCWEPWNTNNMWNPD